MSVGFQNFWCCIFASCFNNPLLNSICQITSDQQECCCMRYTNGKEHTVPQGASSWNEPGK